MTIVKHCKHFVRALALLEPCAVELERQWQEQKSVQSLDPEVPLTRAANPEPASPEVTEATAEPSDGNRRSKRARHCSGYYTDLLKGKK